MKPVDKEKFQFECREEIELLALLDCFAQSTSDASIIENYFSIQSYAISVKISFEKLLDENEAEDKKS